MSTNNEVGEGSLDGIRSQAASLLQAERFAEAEPLIATVLMTSPDDALALNQMALVCERRNETDAAAELSEHVLTLDPNNSIAQNRLRRLGRRPAPRRPAHISARSGSTSGVWTLAEAFPYVDAVLDALTRERDDWILWIEVRDALLADNSALLAIEDWAARQGRPPRIVASLIMAHWNASITRGHNEYDDKYERRWDSNAYRRRRRD